MSLFIGVDIGTTNLKIIASDETFSIIASEKASYPMYQPQDGCFEQDAEEIFTIFITAFKELLSKIDKTGIKTVCFSAAYHSVLAVDEKGKALTPAITWADIRSNAYAKQLKQSGKWKIIYEKTGTPVHPMSPLCKIAWLRDNLPDVFSKTYKFISVKEYIWHKLFGKFQCDYSIASATGLFDSKSLKWCEESLSFCRINESQLSTAVPVLHSESALVETYRKEFGLPADTLFIIGAGDGATANLGCGAVIPGAAALTIGTSAAIRTVSEQSLRDEEGSLFSYVLVDNLFVNGGPVNNGGIVLQWFLQTFLQKQTVTENDFEWLFKEIKNVKPGADGLIFLPYILGERAPVWDAEAKGVFIGIKANHTLQHFMRAVVEGICFSLLHVLNAIEKKSMIDTLYATGGFTQSPIWVQLLSDILNKEIRIINTADASATGAVFMGMYQSGIINSWEQVKRFSITKRRIIPDSINQRVYEKHFCVFSRLYNKLKDDFELLSDKNLQL